MANSTLPKQQEEALYAEINKQVHLRLGEILQAFEMAFIEPSMPVEERKAMKHLILDLMKKSFDNFHPKMKIAWAELVEMNRETPKPDTRRTNRKKGA